MPDGKFRIAELYGAGAMMGFTPQDVDRMSMWQFMAAFNGWAKANSSDKAAKLSDAQADELFAFALEGEKGRILRTKIYWWFSEYPELRGEVEFTV